MTRALAVIATLAALVAALALWLPQAPAEPDCVQAAANPTFQEHKQGECK